MGPAKSPHTDYQAPDSDLDGLMNNAGRIILRLGTNMEQEFGLGYGLKLQGSIAALLGEEAAEEFELFQKFEEAVPG